MHTSRNMTQIALHWPIRLQYSGSSTWLQREKRSRQSVHKVRFDKKWPPISFVLPFLCCFMGSQFMLKFDLEDVLYTPGSPLGHPHPTSPGAPSPLPPLRHPHPPPPLGHPHPHLPWGTLTPTTPSKSGGPTKFIIRDLFHG